MDAIASTARDYPSAVRVLRNRMRKFAHDSVLAALSRYLDRPALDLRLPRSDLPWIAERLALWTLHDEPRMYKTALMTDADVTICINAAWHLMDNVESLKKAAGNSRQFVSERRAHFGKAGVPLPRAIENDHSFSIHPTDACAVFWWWTNMRERILVDIFQHRSRIAHPCYEQGSAGRQLPNDRQSRAAPPDHKLIDALEQLVKETLRRRAKETPAMFQFVDRVLPFCIVVFQAYTTLNIRTCRIPECFVAILWPDILCLYDSVDKRVDLCINNALWAL
jgi:hypothetical protein